jgi:Rha family phage regulatory protein
MEFGSTNYLTNPARLCNGSPVVVNPTAGFDSSNVTRRMSATHLCTGAFFIPCKSIGGSCAGSVSSAGSLWPVCQPHVIRLFAFDSVKSGSSKIHHTRRFAMKTTTNPPVVSAPSPIVTIINNHAATTSLDVARVFEKNHKHVTESIRKLKIEIPNDIHMSNFRHVEIIEENAIGGKVDKSYYEITKDGFILLAMGFTGKKALQFKLAYIEKFNAMERTIKGQTSQQAIPFNESDLVNRITEQIMSRIGGSASPTQPKELDSAGEFAAIFSRICGDIEDEAIARRLWKIFHDMSLVFIGRVADIEQAKGITDYEAGMDEMIARIERLEILKFGKAQKGRKK